jgi:hypothetical protein
MSVLSLTSSRRFTGILAVALIVLPFAASFHARQATATPPASPAARTARAAGLPALSNAEFWRISSQLSEPDGTFHSENLVSNEARFQGVLPELERVAVAGRAYVGVGSEQNFSYITTVRPSHVFILDIRHGNLDLHLLYKAFFETSADRADFVSKMFARPRPAGLTTSSTAEQIFDAFENVQPSQALRDRNLQSAITYLTNRRGFPLSAGDRDGMAYVYNAWYSNGPNIRYQLTNQGGFGRGGFGGVTYASLMTSNDGTGRNRSYLASEESWQFVKSLHERNRIVPVVGNFGGPKALRAVATYLRENGMVVSAFYASNVEQYLRQDGIWDNFCASAATLPMDTTTTLIRSERGGFQGARNTQGGGFALQLLPLQQVVGDCRAK